MTTSQDAQDGEWRIQWDGYTRWRVFEPLGEPSEEGTQSIRIIAECRERVSADRILADHASANALRDALAALELRIKDTSLPEQYTLGLAHAYGLLTGEIRAIAQLEKGSAG